MQLKSFPLGVLTAAAVMLGAIAIAQEDDIFSFIPDGGRTLLQDVQARGIPAGFETAIRTESGDAEFWRARLETAAETSASVAGLDGWQRDTLAQYLAARAPIEPAAELPRDGRDMALALCQSCHIITVVVTQDRTREAWLGTMNSPSHIEIETTPRERELLAEYLVLNAGIPIDAIPPALRAGGASY